MQPEILIFVTRPGRLVEDAGGWRREGRALRYEVGSHVARNLEELARLLEACDRSAPARIDPRKGVDVQDTIRVMDLLRRLGFAEIVFAGSMEND